MPQRIHPCPPSWLFAILLLPSGAFWGFITTAMPFLFRQREVSVDRIAAIAALAGIAQVMFFVWAPVVDMFFRRPTWIWLLSLISALTLFTAILLPLPRSLGWYSVLLVVGNAISSSITTAVYGIMTTLVPDAFRGRAAGWSQAGNLGGGALAGGITIWLAERVPPTGVGLAVSAIVFLPSLAALWIDDPARDLSPSRALFTKMYLELKTILPQRRTLVGLIFFLSPLGAVAAVNLFSGVAVDYHATSETVIWVTGFGGALLNALGSVAGGFLCDVMDRWTAFILVGSLSAISTISMLLAPLSPLTFVIGTSAYLFIAGLCYAAFNALALEVSGNEEATAGTRTSFFEAVGNAPIAYMAWLDGQGYKFLGVRGLLGIDTAGNVVGALALLALLRWFRSGRAVSGKVLN